MLDKEEELSVMRFLESEDETNIEIALTILKNEDQIPPDVEGYLQQYVKCFPLGAFLEWSWRDLTGNIILKIRLSDLNERRLIRSDGVISHIVALESDFYRNGYRKPKYAILGRKIYSFTAMKIHNYMAMNYGHNNPLRIGNLTLLRCDSGFRDNQIDIF